MALALTDPLLCGYPLENVIALADDQATLHAIVMRPPFFDRFSLTTLTTFHAILTLPPLFLAAF